MENNTTERFLILIQHPEKPGFVVSGQERSIGLIGSILLDLSYEGSINIESGKLLIKSTETELSAVHKKVLELIEKSAKTRKIKTWIAKLSRHSRKYQKEILLELETKGYLKIEPKRFLFFKYYKTRLINSQAREQIIDEIRDVIFYDKKTAKDKSMILGLIEACRMYKVICRDKSELKICKKKLKEIIQSDSISRDVDKVIKEMQAAIIGAVLASAISASASSN